MGRLREVMRRWEAENRPVEMLLSRLVRQNVTTALPHRKGLVPSGEQRRWGVNLNFSPPLLKHGLYGLRLLHIQLSNSVLG